ncbi:MAG: efflux RND transporter periplasmic adaptor subunit [Parcubacteria group bacterium]|jgi:RND family efflux transporter MFP subunit
MKKRLSKQRIILFFLIVAVAALFIFLARSSRKQAPVTGEPPRFPQDVSVQSVANSQSFAETIQYPAIIAGDQEIEITSKSSGTAAVVNYSLGSRVGAGSLLVRIDDSGNKQKVGESGFKSADVQQSQLSVEQAKEQLELDKKTYNNLKDQYDYEKKNPTLEKTVTKTQKDAAKEAVDLAEIQLKNAKVGYKGSLDDHLITSPISGYVTQKMVETGDSISVGQSLFKVSKTANVKVQFYVDENQLSSVSRGLEIALTDNKGSEIPFIVRNISPQADSATKRFLIEAYPKQPGNSDLLSGTVVSVSFSVEKTPGESGALILPLSAINVGQNENYIFIAENGKAKKINVDILNVTGETADIKADLPPDSEVIIQGSKLVQDGQEISITQ